MSASLQEWPHGRNCDTTWPAHHRLPGGRARPRPARVLFVAMTVATVSRDRAVERLDHAATTVRTAIGAVCRQLQAVADAVASVPPTAGRPPRQLVSRGLASVGHRRRRRRIRPGAVAAIRTAAGSPTSWPAPTSTGHRDRRAELDRRLRRIGWQRPAALRSRCSRRRRRRWPARTEHGGTARRRPRWRSLPRARSRAGPTTAAAMSAGSRPVPASRCHWRSRCSVRDPVALYAAAAGRCAGAGLPARCWWRAGWPARPPARWRELAWAADRVAGGDLDTRVPVPQPATSWAGSPERSTG